MDNQVSLDRIIARKSDRSRDADQDGQQCSSIVSYPPRRVWRSRQKILALLTATQERKHEDQEDRD